MVWGATIAWYLFLAGMGAGALACAVMVGWAKPEAQRLKTIGMIIAPVAVAVGTLLLMIDAQAGLHNPVRFFGLVSNLSSVMAWGVIILTAFLVVSVIELVIMLRKKSTPRALDVVCLVLALSVAAYTGLLLGRAIGYPLWNPIVLPLLFVVSAASTGCASVLLTGRIVGSAKSQGQAGEGSVPLLDRAGIVLPVVELVLAGILLAVAFAAPAGPVGAASVASAMSLLAGPYAAVFWIGFVGIGLVFPFAVELARRTRARKSASSDGAAPAAPAFDGLAFAGEAGVLVGGFLLRFLVVAAAVPITMGALL